MGDKVLILDDQVLASNNKALDYTQDSIPTIPNSTAILKGNGNGDVVAATAGVDYVSPSGLTTALGDYIPLTQKAANNGVATLDSTGKVPASQLRSSFVVSASAPSDTSLLWIDSDNIMRYYYNSGWHPIVPTWG